MPGMRYPGVLHVGPYYGRLNPAKNREKSPCSGMTGMRYRYLFELVKRQVFYFLPSAQAGMAAHRTFYCTHVQCTHTEVGQERHAYTHMGMKNKHER